MYSSEGLDGVQMDSDDEAEWDYINVIGLSREGEKNLKKNSKSCNYL